MPQTTLLKFEKLQNSKFVFIFNRPLVTVSFGGNPITALLKSHWYLILCIVCVTFQIVYLSNIVICVVIMRFFYDNEMVTYYSTTRPSGTAGDFKFCNAIFIVAID